MVMDGNKNFGGEHNVGCTGVDYSIAHLQLI